jgi:acid stress-induced BolA-like protein IbaG/YrbA
MVTPEQIKVWIETGLPESMVTVSGDGHHFEAVVICAAFMQKNKIQRHRLVYAALGSRMQTEIHALSLQTLTPDEVKP